MTKDIGAAAIGLAVETIQNTIAIEQENKNLKEQLSNNLKLMDDFEVVIPRSKALQQQLKEKKDLIEQKRQELVELQKSVIAALVQKPEAGSPPETSLEAIPIVMNRVQRFITDLSDTAVENKTLAVSILSLVKVNEAIDRLYDAAVDSQVIKETKEERDIRIKNNTNSNQEIINKVRENITTQQQLLKEQQEQQQKLLEQQQEECNSDSLKEQSLKRDVLLPSLKEAAEIAEEEEKPESISKSVSFPSTPTITPTPVANVIAHRPPTPEPDFEQRRDTEAILAGATASETNDTENKE